MAAPTSKQQAHKLISYYLKQYNDQYGSNPPRFNRFALATAFEYMIMDYGYDRSVEIVDYYLGSKDVHSPHLLQYKYGDIDERLTELDDDAAERERLKERTRQQILEAQSD